MIIYIAQPNLFANATDHTFAIKKSFSVFFPHHSKILNIFIYCQKSISLSCPQLIF